MNKPDDSGLVAFKFDEATIDLLLRGLGKLPHDEVRMTIDAMAARARAVLRPAKQEVTPSGPTPIAIPPEPVSGLPFADPNAE